VDSIGKIVYEHRAAGGMWSTAPVSKEITFSEGMAAAKTYAEENGLPWPPHRKVQGKHPGDVESQTVERMRKAAAVLFAPRGPKKESD